GRQLLPRAEGREEAVPALLPLELGQAHQRVRHLRRVVLELADELLQQPERFAPELLRGGQVARDARLDPPVEELLQPLRDLQLDPLLARRALAPRRSLAHRRARLAAELALAGLAEGRGRFAGRARFGAAGRRRPQQERRQQRGGQRAACHFRPSPPTYSSSQSSPSYGQYSSSSRR